MESLFNYLDYRKFLRDFYESQKESHRYFSYRYLGRKIGLDPSFLVKVLQGEKHISEKSFSKISELARFTEEESRYFGLLVSFTKAKRSSDIKLYYEKLISYRKPFVKQLPRQKFEFFAQWHNLAIYEFIRVSQFKGNFKALAKKLIPKVSVPEVEKSVQLLMDLSLIIRNKDGRYVVSDDLITTGEKWESPAIHNFQRSIINLGINALDNIPKKDRDISTVTVGLTREGFSLIQERIQSLRQEILDISKSEATADSVVQFNFEAYPLLKWEREGLK